MNAATVIVGVIVLAVLVAIVANGIYKKKHHSGGCGCNCGGCANSEYCHPKQQGKVKGLSQNVSFCDSPFYVITARRP